MEFYVGQTFKGEYPPEAALWCNEHRAYIEERDGCYVIVAASEPPLEEVKAVKLAEINAACDAALATLTADYPESELLTFDKQEAEARALLADPEADARRENSPPGGVITPSKSLPHIYQQNYKNRAREKSLALFFMC